MAALTRLYSRIRPLSFETVALHRQKFILSNRFYWQYNQDQAGIFFCVSHSLLMKNFLWSIDVPMHNRRTFYPGGSKIPMLSHLQEEVHKIENYPPGFISTNNPHQRITKIHQLMEEACSLNSTHGAELVERLLYKVLSEGLLTRHYSKGVIAVQRDEEWYKEEVHDDNVRELEKKMPHYQSESKPNLENILSKIEHRNDKITFEEMVQAQPQSKLQDERQSLDFDGISEDTFDYYPVYPTIKMYTEAIHAWAKSIPKLSFLEKSSKKKQSRPRHLRKNNNDDATATSITAASNKMSTSAAMRARNLLNLMEAQFERFQEEERLGMIPKPSNSVGDIRGTYCRPPPPDCVCFTGVILAYQKEGNAHDAEKMLEGMISSADINYLIKNGNPSNRHNPDARPDAFCFRTVLHAWVEYVNPDVGLSKARKLLDKMEYLQKHIQDYEYLKPDTWMYNSYMQALVNRTSSKRVWAAWEVMRILESMCESNDGTGVNLVSFNLAIHAMAKLESRKGAVQAEKLLDQMFINYQDLSPLSLSTTKPNSTSFHTVMKAWAGCAKNLDSEKNKNQAKPSDKAEELMKLMNRLYEEDPTEWEQLKPTTVTYNSVLSVLRNCAMHDRAAAEKADHLLVMMWNMFETTGEKDVQPDNVTYDTAIHALINTNRYDSFKRAQYWLEHMYETYSKNGDKTLMPGIHTVGAVLNSWSKWSHQHPDGALRAQKLLAFVQDQHQLNRRLASPDSACYLLTMAAWLKSKSCSSLDRVKFTNDLLKNMELLHQSGISEARPNTAHYNIVLNACGLCQKHDIGFAESERIVELSVKTCQRLRESMSCEADESTYFWILTVIRNLIPEEQQFKYFEELYVACCEEGLVSQRVWQLLEETMPKDWSLSLTNSFEGGTPSSYSCIPAAWKRKVAKK